MSARAPPPDEQERDGAEPPDDDVLAGELVLGVLSGAARTAALARLETDPAFAARVAEWERRLAPWLAQVTPQRVPPELWERLCRELGWRAAAAPRARSIWASLSVWRSAAAVAVVVAVALWLARPPVVPSPSSAPPSRPEPGAKPVSTLARADGAPGWLAAVDPARGTVLMVPVPAPPDAQGRVPELWIIPAGQAPRSLGAVSIDKAHTVTVPPDSRAALVAPGSVFAITLEPAAGMPHAAPSGPVIAKGAIRI